MSQSRICVQKLSDIHKNTIQGLKIKSNSPSHFEKLQAAFWNQKLWRKGTEIKIGFLMNEQDINIERTNIDTMRGNPIDPLQIKFSKYKTPIIEAIKEIVSQRIQPLVNLKFTFVSDPKLANVRINFDPDGGAWSMVGTDCLNEKDLSKATMNLGWFDVGTVLHEFGHVLGMIHEHQNPKGKTIPWNVSAVDKWANETQGWDKKTTYVNIIQKYKSSSINGSDFDPKSIMLYFFPSSLTINNCCGTKQNFRLSITDAEWIDKIYPKNSFSPDKFYSQIYNSSSPGIKSNNLTLILSIGIHYVDG